MRSIKIYSTVGVSGTIETNVTTLGELKPLLRAREIDYSGMKMLVGETRNELNVDEAVLPAGDFKLYLMPQKTKSGCEIEDAIESIEDAEEALKEAKSALVLALGNGSKSVSYAKSSTSREDEEALEDLRNLSQGGPGVKKADPWS
jgi:hypothetical protein